MGAEREVESTKEELLKLRSEKDDKTGQLKSELEVAEKQVVKLTEDLVVKERAHSEEMSTLQKRLEQKDKDGQEEAEKMKKEIAKLKEDHGSQSTTARSQADEVQK